MSYTLLPVVSVQTRGFSMRKHGAVTVTPHTTFRSDYAEGVLESKRERRLQKARRALYFSNPTPYTLVKAWEERRVGEYSSNSLSLLAGEACSPEFSSPIISRTINKARERFVEKLREVAEVGEFVGESGKTLKTMSSVLTPVVELFSSLRAVRRGDVKPIVRLLQRSKPGVSSVTSAWTRADRWPQRRAFMKRLQNRKNFVKDSDAVVANAWLELQYGIIPAIGTIYDVADAMSGNLPYGEIYGSARDSWTERVVRSGATGWTTHRKVDVSVRVRGHVSLVNTTGHTLEQFGVLNPAALAWELTPFSLVVDWFANVGNWLRGFSDTAGFDIQNACVSQKRKAVADCEFLEGAPWGVTQAFTTTAISSIRTVGFPSVTLTRQKGLTLLRAVNAIAMVTSIGHSVLNSKPVLYR